MKRIFFTMLLLSSFLKAQDNSMLNANFWKSKPDVTAIKAEVSKGNNPAQYPDLQSYRLSQSYSMVKKREKTL